MLNVLVTGAAGFVGSHTIETLLANGHRVTGVDNLRTGRKRNLRSVSNYPGWQFYEQDILDAESFHRVGRKTAPEVILHLAALVSVQQSMLDPELNFELDVRATHIVTEAAHLVSVRRLVFASSAAVYGEARALPLDETSPTEPLSPYGAAKLAGEVLVLGAGKTYGFESVCLRYFNIYGARQRVDSRYGGVVGRILTRLQHSKAPVIFGDGRQTRDFIHVKDVARANALAIGSTLRRNGVCNICTGRGTSVNELVENLRRMYGSPPAPAFESPRPGEIRYSEGDPARAREWYDFAPRITLAEGLAERAREFGALQQAEARELRHPVEGRAG